MPPGIWSPLASTSWAAVRARAKVSERSADPGEQPDVAVSEDPGRGRWSPRCRVSRKVTVIPSGEAIHAGTRRPTNGISARTHVPLAGGALDVEQPIGADTRSWEAAQPLSPRSGSAPPVPRSVRWTPARSSQRELDDEQRWRRACGDDVRERLRDDVVERQPRPSGSSSSGALDLDVRSESRVAPGTRAPAGARDRLRIAGWISRPARGARRAPR